MRACLVRSLMRLLFALLFFGSWPARAANLPGDARLAPVRGALESVVDGAARDGLPESLLVDKIREGLAKGVPAPRIAVVVRALADSLAAARAEALPRTVGAPSPQLLKAIVDARALGAKTELTELLTATRGLPTQTRAVEVLGDLAQRGYPTAAAARAIADFARRPAELDRLAARAESLLQRGASRTEALEALHRAAASGAAFDSAGHGLSGDDDGHGPNRESEGPRGPKGNNGNHNGKP